MLLLKKIIRSLKEEFSSERYYHHIPSVKEYDEITDTAAYSEMPDDWYVIVTDIKDSTGAIEAGKYKTVNSLSASVIAAVKNAVKQEKFPFVFGGDGTSLCIHETHEPAVRKALAAIKAMARIEFGMVLRAGIVPVERIKRDGYRLLISKLRYSDNFEQALFQGGGIEYAEKLLKDEKESQNYEVADSGRIEDADITGLECRWDVVQAPKGVILNLLVKAVPTGQSDSNRIYEEVIFNISKITGDLKESHPVIRKNLRFTTGLMKLYTESKLRRAGKGAVVKSRYLLSVIKQVLFGVVLMSFKVRTSQTNWGNYKDDLIMHTDYLKFDDMIRTVLSCTENESVQIEAMLQNLFAEGKIIYGISKSDSSQLTCIVSKYEKEHFHLVDGTNGGYTKAAVQLKQRMREREAAKSAPEPAI